MKIIKGNDRSYIMDKEHEVGAVELSSAGDSLIIIASTHVDDAYKGQGLATQLIERVVEDARATGKKIIPLCSFAVSEFERKPEYRDTLNNA